jgi:hypothetical protein
MDGEIAEKVECEYIDTYLMMAKQRPKHAVM